MAIETTFIVQPFVLGKRGKGLAQGQAERTKSEDDAKRRAERMMGTGKLGVVVLREEADPEADAYGEPALVTSFGQVPEGLVEALAA